MCPTSGSDVSISVSSSLCLSPYLSLSLSYLLSTPILGVVWGVADAEMVTETVMNLNFPEHRDRKVREFSCPNSHEKQDCHRHFDPNGTEARVLSWEGLVLDSTHCNVLGCVSGLMVIAHCVTKQRRKQASYHRRFW